MSTWTRRIVAFAVTAVCITPALTAHGDESLGDRKYWQGQMDYMKDHIDKANEKCGTHITFDWVDKANLRAKAEAEQASPNGICQNILDNLWTVCNSGDAESKKRVQQKVHSVTCGYGKPRTMTISGGRLNISTSNSEPNFDDWAQKKLGDML